MDGAGPWRELLVYLTVAAFLLIPVLLFPATEPPPSGAAGLPDRAQLSFRSVLAFTYHPTHCPPLPPLLPFAQELLAYLTETNTPFS